MNKEERMAWSGQCDKCLTLYTIAPSDEASDDEQEAISREWPVEGDCFVQDCLGIIQWNGNDPIASVLKHV